MLSEYASGEKGAYGCSLEVHDGRKEKKNQSKCPYQDSNLGRRGIALPQHDDLTTNLYGPEGSLLIPAKIRLPPELSVEWITTWIVTKEQQERPLKTKSNEAPRQRLMELVPIME